MLQILYFDHWQGGTEYYRAMPLDYIKHESFTITRSTERDIKAHLLNNYDVIIIMRPSSETHLNLIKLAKDMGIIVISDYDDDPLHLPETNPMHGTYEGDKAHTLKCIALSDEIWAATDGIKQSFRLYNKNVHIIPNSHNDTLFPISQKASFKYNKKAMWRGGFSHVGDIYEPGVTEWILKQINGNRKWNFYWLGQKFEWLEYRIKYGNFYYSNGAATVQFYKLMHKLNPCIFFYPLQTNIFNRSKSNCSWLESVFSGATYFGNTDLPEFQQVGILPLADLPKYLKGDHSIELEKNHNESWQHIQDNLLLSKVNLLRKERLETYIKCNQPTAI